MMEVIKCVLCKEEIEYAQRCRVYIKTDKPRPFQRVSKRPHIGRFKLISTANSTEHISFARRLKRLRKSKSSANEKDVKKSPSAGFEETPSNSEKKQAEKKESYLKRRSLQIVKKKHSVSGKVPEALKALNNSKRTPRKETVKNSSDSKKFHTALVPNNNTEQNMNFPHFQSSFEEYIKPILSKNNSSTKPALVMNPVCNINKTTQEPDPPKLVKNTEPTFNPTIDCETYYWLELAKPKQQELRKLGYSFENLVAEVKHMKLPNADWKIKIMVHKQEMVSVSFTKKMVPEKVVSVNAKSLVCEITIEGKKAILIGSPAYIQCIKDLEIMLDIVNDIQPDSPMISYTRTV